MAFSPLRPLLARTWAATAAVMLLAAGLGALTGTPAAALGVVAGDPVDTPATADVQAVGYHDAELATVTRVKVRRLPNAGALVVRIGRPGSGAAYVVKVARSGDGTLATSLAHVTPGSRQPRACSVGAAWSTATDVVRVTVPQSCLDFGRFLTRHVFQATFASGGRSDRAPARVVARGDSPGCVNPGEFGSLRFGQPMDLVHARFDTAGAFEGAQNGTFTRSYTGCGDGTAYLVTYRLDSRSVVEWNSLGPPPAG